MTIRLNKPEKLSEVLATLTEAAKKFNITNDCGLTKGSASGRGFAGNYVVNDDHILVMVTKKPALIPKSTVEKEVKKYWEQICEKVKSGK